MFSPHRANGVPRGHARTPTDLKTSILPLGDGVAGLCPSQSSRPWKRRDASHEPPYWLAPLAGVLTTGDSPLAALEPLAAAPAALLARFAASLLPGVPLTPAELLMTPLLPVLRASLPLSVRLQAGAAAANAATRSATSAFFRIRSTI